MKLLILTPYIPYPINSGGNLGFFGLVDRIRKHVDVSIILIARLSQQKDIEELQKLWNNVTFYIYRKEDLDTEKLSFKYNLMSSLSESFERKVRREKNSKGTDFVRQHSVASYDNSTFYRPLDAEYLRFVDSIVNNNSFDLIQVDFFELIDVVNILPINIKKLFIHHELRFVRSECELQLFQNQKPSDLYIHNYSKAYELQHLKLYDGVASMTDVDKYKLEQEGVEASKVYVSPAIVDIQTKGLSDSFVFKNKIVYLGGSDHFPNYDAVDWFISNCWDNIYKENSSLEFHIIGSWKSKVAKQYEEMHPGVIFRGFVEDLSVELAESIMIVPLRIGSGVRMKILEAISLGCPVISTHVGAEGIGLENMTDVIYADTPVELSAAIYLLSSDADLCNQIRNGAYAKLISRPNPDALAKIRLEIYKDILSK